VGTQIKVEHYIPRFYLRAWSIKGKKHHLYCFDKSKHRKFESSIKNMGCETYFYDIPEDFDQQVEKNLSKSESLFHSAHDELVAMEDPGDLTATDKEVLAYFVVSQMIRTKGYREELKEIVKGLTDKSIEMAKRFPKEKVREAVQEKLGDPSREEDMKLWQISHLQILSRLADVIRQMHWVVLVNQTSLPFWSSDYPVNLHNDIYRQTCGSLGLSCRGIQVHFPLSPTACLHILDPTTYASFPTRYEVKDIRNVEFENSLQVVWAMRFIFSNENDFSLAQKMIKDVPSLAANGRERCPSFTIEEFVQQKGDWCRDYWF
jgi:hypothetical protein